MILDKNTIHDEITAIYKNKSHIHYDLKCHSIKGLLPLISGDKDSKKAIYTLHGYMGSPHEMSFLTESIPEKDQFFIWHDLILGYGNNPEFANEFTRHQFYEHTKKNLDAIFSHYDEIHLSGFSTGGLLITKYLIDHPKFHHKVKSLHLISPFYFPFLKILPKLNHLLNKKIKLIDVPLLYLLTRFPDVKVMLIEPQFFHQKIPLKAAEEIEKLASEVVKEMQSLKAISSFIYITKKDRVLSFKNTVPFMKKYFNSDKLYLFNEKRSPHHLLHPKVSHQSAIIIKNFLKSLE